jgi:NTP pyrophosphatase (non-canonical NTP hydrolase)
MKLSEYQDKASGTDQTPGSDDSAVLIPLLGIAGEAASLLVEYKKWLRDGEAHRLYRKQVAEELGDILWYVANLASKFSLDLDDIATANIAKTQHRWGAVGRPSVDSTMPFLFDEEFPPSEQFPREMTADIEEVVDPNGGARVKLTIDGRRVGNELQDNAYEDDGYRFHDVFHLGNVALLGWSPTIRGLLRRKRRSSPEADSVEDGGRAIVVDEGIAAYVFAYAKRHAFLDGVHRLDYELLRTIKSLTDGLEVSARSAAEWENAILRSYAIWRIVRAERGGRVRLNLRKREYQLVSA